MKRVVLALLVAVSCALPQAFACSMYDQPGFLPLEDWGPPVTVSTDTPDTPDTTTPTTPAEESEPPPPPPPIFADCPPILFETLGGREEPRPADAVVQWVEETLVLS